MINDEIIAFKNPKSIAAESFRALRTNLEFSMTSNDDKIILVTSSHVSEGKSSTSANLATVFAMQDKKTILIDADLRRGIQHKNFGVSNQDGLSSYLANMSDFKKLIKHTEIKNLDLINRGPVPPNPAELVSTEKMKKLLEDLRNQYDIVIIDGAPVLPVTDSVILSAICDKVVLVVSYGETHKDELKASQQSLTASGANIAGVVITKIDVSNKGYSKYGKGYYHNYAYYNNETENK